MHSFVEAIDNCTLDRKAFLYIVESMDQYNINMTASDVCLSRIIETPEPLNNFMVQPCREDAYCKHCLSSGPSIAYALSHRLLNMIFRRNVRRCFIQSAAQDEILNDQMCAFMYREAVYLARRGFFARDLFLEHGKE
ncbi:unnamed protein product [Leptosia nina]|uniref:Uncharacterized protein n=1 Tax=Leptosia nina TaxID=320188 RepID=A0AAV1JEV0_9NEOP